ncbi:MAG: hypothetical protein DVB29_01835 [Verrucomicrobia bacterium]|nr:MAG: hypothetical protein DVB29_01835 [Verrucomicrobiota bacterium]
MLLGQYETYSRRRNPSPSLTRSLPLVSPLLVLPKGKSPPRSPDRRWCPICLCGLIVTIGMKYPD